MEGYNNLPGRMVFDTIPGTCNTNHIREYLDGFVPDEGFPVFVSMKFKGMADIVPGSKLGHPTEFPPDTKYLMVLSEHDFLGERFKEEGSREAYIMQFLKDPKAMLVIKNNTEPMDPTMFSSLEFIHKHDADVISERVVVLVNDVFLARSYQKFLKHLGTEAIVFICSYNNFQRAMVYHDDADTEPARISMYTRSFKDERGWLYLHMLKRGLLDKIWHTFWPNRGYDVKIANQMSVDEMMSCINRNNYRRQFLQNNPDLELEFRQWLADAPYKISEHDTYDNIVPSKNFLPPINIVIETVQHDMAIKMCKHYQGSINVLDHIDPSSTTFLTEKTLYLMLKKKAFIVYGPPGTYQKLHHMGFKTFGRWWDEDRLSSEDINLRIDAICDITNDLVNMSDKDFQAMISDMADIFEHNYNIASLYAKQDVADFIGLVNHLKDWCYE